MLDRTLSQVARGHKVCCLWLRLLCVLDGGFPAGIAHPMLLLNPRRGHPLQPTHTLCPTQPRATISACISRRYRPVHSVSARSVAHVYSIAHIMDPVAVAPLALNLHMAASSVRTPSHRSPVLHKVSSTHDCSFDPRLHHPVLHR